MLGLYKPSTMVTHPAPGHWNGTVVNAVLGYLKRTTGIGLEGVGEEGLRPGVVHRLDKGEGLHTLCCFILFSTTTT